MPNSKSQAGAEVQQRVKADVTTSSSHNAKPHVMRRFFKYKNSYGDDETWWLYAKIIEDNGDGETCQVFEFETTTRDNHFVGGMAKPFGGSIDTNKYSYYCDYYGECTEEEFNAALKIFMQNLNKYVDTLYERY